MSVFRISRSLLKTRPPTLAGPAARRAGGTTRDCLPEVTTDSLRDRSMMEAQKTNRSHLPGYYARVHTHRYAPTAAFAACMHPCNGGPVGCPDKEDSNDRSVGHTVDRLRQWSQLCLVSMTQLRPLLGCQVQQQFDRFQMACRSRLFTFR
eukprot:GHVU01213114.1.p1 GENE.GHVU01213114.1~~GHVU01213114.1.p1  ORF type:complete len:150 (+),score=7.08 GHVU01213114.1:166-615(+)